MRKERIGTGALASAAFASLALSVFLGSAPALADDEPGVARVSLLNGDIDLERGDSGDTVAAAINAPIVAGDYLSTGDGSRSEVQLDWGNMLRLGSDAQVRFTRLDPNAHSVQLAAGTVELAVLQQTDAHPEVDTPSVGIRPDEHGLYRITVEGDGTTLITVRSGRADLLLAQGTQLLTPGNTMLVQGPSSNPQFQFLSAVAYDDFDRWNDDRDRQLDGTISYRYASDDIVGAYDLDGYGRWVDEAGYGNVWVPYAATGWAPYHDGRWVWEPYYGWTWVSYEPWGWAPYHYGRWFYAAGTGWCWYPGPAHVRAVWQPALVAFVGFGAGGAVSLSFGFGNIGWVPLAPYEPFRPWWGPGYVNHTTIVNNITNVTYITNNTSYRYRNLLVNNAVTAVSAQNFAAGRFDRRVAVEPARLHNVALVNGPLPIVPTAHNLRLTETGSPHVATATALEQRFHAFPSAARAPLSFEAQRNAVQSVTHRLYPQHETPREVHDRLTPAAPRTHGATQGVYDQHANVRRETTPSKTDVWNRFGSNSPTWQHPSTEHATVLHVAAPQVAAPQVTTREFGAGGSPPPSTRPTTKHEPEYPASKSPGPRGVPRAPHQKPTPRAHDEHDAKRDQER